MDNRNRSNKKQCNKKDKECEKNEDDWQVSRGFIAERAEHLLKMGMWTDCRFKVGIDEQIVEAHKLILAMSSPVFEAMFFGSMAEKQDIVISDVEPDAFKSLLLFIYTDNVTFTSIDQASQICYAAKKYMLKHLVKKCTTFMWSDLRPTNVCQAYEFAKLFEETDLMNTCLSIMRRATMQVLNGDNSSFKDAEFDTILTIYEQDKLCINSELDLFSAIERYATKFVNKSVKRKVAKTVDESDVSSELTENISEDNLQKIREVIMKIRLLSLTPKQFAEGPAKSNFLTKSEKYAIVMNICSEESDTPMPEGFNTSRIRRQFYNGYG